MFKKNAAILRIGKELKINKSRLYFAIIEPLLSYVEGEQFLMLK